MDSDTLIEQPPPAINLSASTIHRAVERVDAKDFREQIIRLFESNGNFQFAQRFDWYYRDRSQPAPISFVLRDKNLRVFGLCSVNLRDLRFGKIAVRAGVAGNLVVDRSIGAYLAPFALVTAMKSLVDSGEIDVLLGVPNDLAKPMFSRLGFFRIGGWSTRVLISKSRDLMKFYFGSTGNVLSPLIDLGAACRQILFRRGEEKLRGQFRVIDLTEDALRKLPFEDWPKTWRRFEHSVSGAYLVDRFLGDPLHQFSIVGVIVSNRDVCAYLVLRRSPGRIWIADCGVDHRLLSETTALLVFCNDQRVRNCTVWIPTLSESELSQQISGCGLVKVPASMGGYPDYSLLGYWRSDHALAKFFAQATSWHLFPGFNDV